MVLQAAAVGEDVVGEMGRDTGGGLHVRKDDRLACRLEFPKARSQLPSESMCGKLFITQTIQAAPRTGIMPLGQRSAAGFLHAVQSGPLWEGCGQRVLSKMGLGLCCTSTSRPVVQLSLSL